MARYTCQNLLLLHITVCSLAGLSYVMHSSALLCGQKEWECGSTCGSEALCIMHVMRLLVKLLWMYSSSCVSSVISCFRSSASLRVHCAKNELDSHSKASAKAVLRLACTSTWPAYHLCGSHSCICDPCQLWRISCYMEHRKICSCG